MDQIIDIKNLGRCAEISRQSRAEDSTPFGALLVDKDGNILLGQSNVKITESKCTGHVKAQVVGRASQLHSKDCLRNCAPYTITKPCAICAGAIYWAGIRQVVYGITEKNLLAQTGSDPQNPTLNLPYREVFARDRKKVEVVRLLPELVEEVAEVHKGYWSN